MKIINKLESELVTLQQSKPLVLCLTNVVTMDLMANSLLALGAAPLMSQSMEELEELVCLSQAVYINIGTLDQAFSERAVYAAEIAKAKNKPLILDPVGAGASRLRTDLAQHLSAYATIIRGNASEILALADNLNTTKGVEAVNSVEQASAAAKRFARLMQAIVVVSGPVDLISDGSEEINLPFGSPLMPLVIGLGCTLGAVIAAFAALNLKPFDAAVLATAYFSLCGQQSFQQAQEPGLFKQYFINSLYRPDWVLFKDWVSVAEL